MAKPFQVTLLPNAKPLTRKAGWHKRELAASRRHRVTTAPQRGNPDADAKAVQYAEWLAARDGTTLPGGDVIARVDWQPCAHGWRPCAVEWHPAPQGYRPRARGIAEPVAAPLLRIELPHWSYEAPPVVEVALLEWSAPVVTELPAADHARLAAVVDPREPAAAVEPVTVDHIEPMALCPAVGMPCKVDCGFRAGCTPRQVATDAGPSDPLDGAPAPHLCGDDVAPVRVQRQPRAPRRAARTPVVVIPTRTPGEGIQGRIAPASMAIPLRPMMRATLAPLHSAPTL